MGRANPYSLVLAAHYRTEANRIGSALQKSRGKLAAIGVHHVVVYVSDANDGRVFITIGIRQREPIEQLLRSSEIFEWFDEAGVEDLPAIFAGETVEKINFHPPSATFTVAGSIVAVLARVADVEHLLHQVHQQQDRLRGAGIDKLWIYRAFDDEREVLMLHEVEDPERARRWIDHPDEVAEWMATTGRGPYPEPFLGSLAHVMAIADPG